MRIGINGVSVVTGGNVTYFSNLLPVLGDLLAASGHEAFIYTRERGRVTVPSSPALVERCIATEAVSGARRVAWEQSVLPWHVRRDHIDLFYGPTDIVPLGLTCPSVCAFRNPNIYVPIPEMAAGDRMRLTALRGLAIGSAQRCRRAIFVSGAARDEIAPVLRLDPAKARVIHHGLGRVFRDALTGPRPWDRPYILTVSTQYEYKNTPRLIEAFARFVHGRGLPHGLVVVGALVERPTATRIQETIARLGLGDVVRLAGEVGYPAVGAWYSHASAFVFPSWRETFGHPLLEAMAADLPIAAADIPVMREIAADAARYFDPRSVDAMGEAILQALYDPNRAALIARGRERLSAFSWETSARRTLDVFSEAAG